MYEVSEGSQQKRSSGPWWSHGTAMLALTSRKLGTPLNSLPPSFLCFKDVVAHRTANGVCVYRERDNKRSSPELSAIE